MKFDKKLLKKYLPAFLAVAAVFVLLMMINGVKKSTEPMIYGAEDVPRKEAALVLGAGVSENGKLSDMFRDRIDTAVGLYMTGKVDKVLVSGDHGRKEYDEVNAAKDYLLLQGVPGEDIFLDHAGFDTYDSVYRARDVFEAKSMIVVTQGYHLPRALYIADKLGVEAVGVGADLHPYGGQYPRDLRENFAVVKAYLDVVLQSKPKYLGAKIPLTGDGSASWD